MCTFFRGIPLREVFCALCIFAAKGHFLTVKSWVFLENFSNIAQNRLFNHLAKYFSNNTPNITKFSEH